MNLEKSQTFTLTRNYHTENTELINRENRRGKTPQSEEHFKKYAVKDRGLSYSNKQTKRGR